MGALRLLLIVFLLQLPQGEVLGGCCLYANVSPSTVQTEFSSPRGGHGHQTSPHQPLVAAHAAHLKSSTWSLHLEDEENNRPCTAGSQGGGLEGGGLRLRGGMVRKALLADKVYKKRRDMEDMDANIEKERLEEEEELDEKYRGMPLEERLKKAFEPMSDHDDDDDDDVVGDDDDATRKKPEPRPEPAAKPKERYGHMV